MCDFKYIWIKNTKFIKITNITLLFRSLLISHIDEKNVGAGMLWKINIVSKVTMERYLFDFP